jgi:hypothetical protein
MHISLDSALGRQRRLNSVGESITQIAPDPAAAYSLRSLTGADPKVVRVRRASDNHEQDFTASDVSSGALQDFVNAQVVAPLDIQALSATGRDGDFLIAKAAYSLRSLGTRQATVTSSGDTAGDTSGKFVCQVRSVTGDIKSFTATEVSDGTLVDFVLGNTKSLLNSRAYFDGSNDNVKLTSEINLTGDFSLEYSFVVTEANQQIIGKETGGSYIRAQGTDGITLFRIQTNGSAVNLTLTSTLKYSEANTIKLKRVSGKFGIYNESDVLISNESTLSDTFTVQSFGRARGTFAKGVIYNIRIDTNNDGTINHSYNGYGNTLSDWTDLVGSNNATAVSGSPALFTGQDQDGFVKTWYDQSVTTQAGDTATGNHATQATAANQPKIVENGSLLTLSGKPTIKPDGTDDFLINESSIWDTISNSALSCFTLTEKSSVSNKILWAIGSSSNEDGDWLIGGAGTAGNVQFRGGRVNSANSSIGTSGTVLLTALDVSGGDGFVDGTAIGSPSSATPGVTADRLVLFNRRGSSSSSTFTDQSISEVIFYGDDQTDNRTAIEANMGEVYSIDLPSGVDPGFDQVDGFVETWYDQSGNGNDAVQATASLQPKIVNAGSLLADGVTFDGSDDVLTSINSSLTNYTFAGVYTVKTIADNAGFLGKGAGGSDREFFVRMKSDGKVEHRVYSTGSSSTFDTIASSASAISADTTALIAGSFNGSTNAIRLDIDDTVLTATSSVGLYAGTSSLTIPSALGNEAHTAVAELLFYNTDESGKLADIKTNINSHYSIF